jgi:hypothetical protein
MRRTKTGLVVLFVLSTLLTMFPSTAFAQGKEKAGRWMFNIRLGAAANLGCGSFHCERGRFAYNHSAQFVASPEVAVALDRGYHAYIGIIPMFQVGDDFTIINVPLTFQYDIELPVKGLYIYPKVNSGYSRWLEGDGNYFNIEPAVGVKYQFHRHVHAGAEPLGFMFYVGERNGRSDFNAQYHFLGHIGFDV